MLPNPDNLEFLEDLYATWLTSPERVDARWVPFFEQMGAPDGFRQPQPRPRSIFNPASAEVAGAPAQPSMEEINRLAQVWRMVNAYRVRGHVMARVDPLDRMPVQPHPDLDPATYGFSEADMDTVLPAGGLFGVDKAPLREILDRLRQTYCGSIGVEFMNISDPGIKTWLQERMEKVLNRRPLDRDEEVHLLEKLLQAEGLEQFLHTKFVGSKRFSLEGAEGTIALLDLLLEEFGRHDALEVVVGMAHRGRLNVLHTILNKSAQQLFSEFEDVDPMATLGSGDVKYHMGFSSDWITRDGKKLHLSLTANPSHLEAVDPVVVGRVRAKQDREAARLNRRGCVGLLMHGDAAFAGQGLVPETLNLADLDGFSTGGTVHLIINNHIGFTTSPRSSRSTPYCTDVAKMMQIPIFHVSGEDVEAMAQVARLAAEFRWTFQKDVVIDLHCYRRYGHNELDEPSFTQPLLYKTIQTRPSLAETYMTSLLASGRVTRAEVDSILGRQRGRMEEALSEVRSGGVHKKKRDEHRGTAAYWRGYRGGADAATPDVDTGVDAARLEDITQRMMKLPEGFTPHPKTLTLMKKRLEMGKGEAPLDWGMAELLAYGTLLTDGHPVRLSGQDCRRGTFSHRHAARTDIKTGEEYIPLAHLTPDQGKFSIFDSSLSEAGVLGFEWGYSLDYPDALVMWEAQFGDFANGAQVIIDQFISSAEDKWGRLSGLVMLLPHGYEGQGPEHSSARLERYLQLCGDDNIQVANPTTPANLFHLLRRQVHRPIRKPLVIMSPKSLLRHPRAVSDRELLTRGSFQRVLADPGDPAQVTRLLLCSGKLYYDLSDLRQQLGRDTDVIARVEQLYPLPERELRALISSYPHLKEVMWVQEEPEQMGAWHYMLINAREALGGLPLSHASRARSASPATGSHKAHLIEARMIMEAVFGQEARQAIHNYYRVEY